MSSAKAAIFGLGLLALARGGGTERPGCPAVVLAPAAQKIRDVSPWCWQPPVAPLQMASARNEYESFQVVVNRPGSLVSAISISWAAGTPAELVDQPPLVHAAAYIDIKIPSDCDGAVGRWPDALVPDRDVWFNETRNALPATVKHANGLFWVDLFVPPATAAGNYTAAVSATVDGEVVATAGIALRVFGFSLPSTSAHYKSSYGLSSAGVLMAKYQAEWHAHTAEALHLTQQYVEMGLMHRLSFSHGLLGVDPGLAKDPVDWPAFNSRWQGFFGPPGRRLPFGLTNASLTAVEVDSHDVGGFARNAKQHGWASKIADKVCDEPASNASWAECASNCAAVHAASPSTRCEVTTSMGQLLEAVAGNATSLRPADVGVFTALINLVENSAKQCSDFPTWTFKNTRPMYDAWLAGDPRNEFWMYQSCMSEGCYPGVDKSLGCDKNVSHGHYPCESGWPSLMIDAPSIMNRIFPSLGYFYNATGELYWHVNYCDTCTVDNVVGNCPTASLPEGAYGMDAWHDQLVMGGNGDGTLTYPGRPEVIGGNTFIPVASIRMKQLRDGMEDNEYYHLLEEARGREAAMAQLKKVVTNAFTYTRDVGLWERTRLETGALIEASLATVAADSVGATASVADLDTEHSLVLRMGFCPDKWLKGSNIF